MRLPSGSTAAEFLVAVISTALIAILCLAISAAIGPITSFLVPFTIAVTVSSWRGGWRAGALATALSAATAWFFFLPEKISFGFAPLGAADVFRLVAFIIASAGICALAENLLRARRRIEVDRASLREREAELELVMNATPMYLTRCSRDLRYLFVNRATAATLGRPAEEIAGKPIADILGAETFGRIRPHIDRVLRGEFVEFEEMVHYPGAGWKSIRAHYTPERGRGGEVAGWIATVEDISQRKLHEERLRLLGEASAILLTSDNLDAMLKALFDTISAHLNADAYINYTTEDGGGVLRLTSWRGITDEQARSIERLDFGQAVCGTVAIRKEAMVCGSIQQSDDPRTQIVRGWGVRAYVCHPLMVGDRLLGTLSFASRTREAFDDGEVQFLRTISGYVATAHERLRLIKQLQDADRRKDDFLAVLSHELRTPLTSGFGWVKLLSKDGNHDLMADGLRAIEGSFAAQIKLVEDLLDVSRIVSGRLEIEQRPVQVDAVVAEALEEMRGAAEAKGMELRSGALERVVVMGDEARLKQIVRNLLSNGIKFTGERGTVSVELTRRDGQAAIVVEDDGLGIEPRFLPRVFERFSQADGVLARRNGGGLGLGLSIVASLVEAHGGTVRAESDGNGKGSRFTVTIPVVSTIGDGPDQALSELVMQDLSGLRVLVVDDDKAARAMMVHVLESAGAMVRSCENAGEAFDEAWRWQPSALVTDLAMPLETGYSVIRRLRETGHLMPTIAVTACAGGEDAMKAREAGFDRYIAKPFAPETLVGAVFEITRQLA